MATGKNCKQMNPRSSPIDSQSVTFTRVLRVLKALRVTVSPSYSPFSCWWRTVDKTWIHHSGRSSASPFRRSMCFLFWDSIWMTISRDNLTWTSQLVIGWYHRCSFRLKLKIARGTNNWGRGLKNPEVWDTTYTFVLLTTELGTHPQPDENLTSVLYC